MATRPVTSANYTLPGIPATLKKIADDLTEDNMDDSLVDEEVLPEEALGEEDPLDEEFSLEDDAPVDETLEDPGEVMEDFREEEHENILDDAAMKVFDVLIDIPGFEHLDGFKREDFVEDFKEALSKHMRLEGEDAVEVEMGEEPTFEDEPEPIEDLGEEIEVPDLSQLDEEEPGDLLEQDLLEQE